MKQIYGNFALLLAACIWGFAFVAQSIGMDYISPFTFQAVRCLLGAAVLVPVFLLMDRSKKRRGTYRAPKPQERRRLWTGGICCGVVLCVAANLQQIAIQYTTVAKAGFITSMYLVVVPIFSVFLGKKPPRKTWLCILLAAVGLYFMSIRNGFSLSVGDSFAVACSLCFALHIMSVDHFAPGLDGVRLSCIQFLVAGLLSAIPMVLLEHPAASAILAAWAPILYTGILSCGVAYTCQIIGQQVADPTIATLFMSLESVFSLVGGLLILRQIPSGREFFGCALVFGAVLLSQLPMEKWLSRRISQ